MWIGGTYEWTGDTWNGRKIYWRAGGDYSIQFDTNKLSTWLLLGFHRNEIFAGSQEDEFGKIEPWNIEWHGFLEITVLPKCTSNTLISKKGFL